MVVDAFVYMYGLSLSASLGVLTAVLIGMKIINKKQKSKQQNVIG
ncbi:hypothetical protein P9Z75_26920 [Bacillus tropicus]|jgi:hypothetical protein|uniref:Uncharacterized protein n=1 Tax=Bacillus thuringiensis serovar toumanoffi TaxID=180862 RepID=A0ABD5HS23_BACTU|nr:MULTISPECIES: hypothetical protein [Bacillus cereus group]MDW9207763.1 hypothetical protein [Bacillus thuringiensis serovar toumanoffi]ETE88977.1 hypothetical protein C623_0232710 [Bacillus thuringiensis serovar aizawai str. Hu4-2]MDA2543700.1 hypothetical protein [Bacillus cereus]MEC2958580.1 hypothetical protein [Bacillus cereus]MEC3127224.1 hypothetical protein [Bacillus tropicus]